MRPLAQAPKRLSRWLVTQVLPLSTLPWITGLRAAVRGRGSKISASVIFEVLRVQEGSNVLYIPARSRTLLYRDGIAARLNYLSDRYSLPGFAEVRSGDTVMDVGCHIGEFALAASASARRVICIDGDPVAYALARLNCANSENIKIINDVLGERVEQITLHLDTANADSSVVNQNSNSLAIKIEASTLERMIEAYGPVDFLKMDAEGFEPEVLAGAGHALGHVDRLAIDCGPERRGVATVDAVRSLLEEQFELNVKNDVVFGRRRAAP